MPFQVSKAQGDIEVVVSKDSSVGCDKEGYQAYLKSFSGDAPNEAILKLKGEPTRFLLKRELSWQEKQKLRARNIKIKGKQINMNVNYSAELARAHLVGIRNPTGMADDQKLEFTTDIDGLASRVLMNKLDTAGVIGDLVSAVSAASEVGAAAEGKNS